MIATALVTASAAMVFMLGALHCCTRSTAPSCGRATRPAARRWRSSALVLTRETTVWKAWIGFNASHSLGAMLYGVVYADLALAHPAVLWASPVLLVTGGALLATYAWLGPPLLVQRAVSRHRARRCCCTRPVSASR